MLLVSSSVMYFIESAAGTKGFESIPATMWWSVVTLTTLGYGDVYPATALGKLVAGVIVVLGIGLFALPTSILTSGFLDQMRQGDKDCQCPHCGGSLD